MVKVLVTTKMMQDPALFEDFADEAEFVFVDPPQFLSEEECLALVDGIDVWICGDDRLTRRVAEKASETLKLVIKWGAGFDSIDTLALQDLGIRFRHTPGVLSNAVAEYALGLTLSLLRHIHTSDQAVRSGEWPKITGEELSGKTVGIVGFGSVGRAVGQKFTYFGCQVIHSDPSSPDSISLDKLLNLAHIVVLCANLTEQTKGILGYREFCKMRRDSLLVNVSRGELLVEEALIEAIKSESIRGAALDVFLHEPLLKTNPLLFFQNVLLSPHNASNTYQARSHANSTVLKDLRSFLGLNHGLRG